MHVPAGAEFGEWHLAFANAAAALEPESSAVPRNDRGLVGGVQEMAVFHVVAEGAQLGSTSKASPSRLTMHVPLAALPSPVASDITLHIPKARFSCTDLMAWV
jgi:hypothetical protein